jgi:hypothetical protein
MASVLLKATLSYGNLFRSDIPLQDVAAGGGANDYVWREGVEYSFGHLVLRDESGFRAGAEGLREQVDNAIGLVYLPLAGLAVGTHHQIVHLLPSLREI